VNQVSKALDAAVEAAASAYNSHKSDTDKRTIAIDLNNHLAPAFGVQLQLITAKNQQIYDQIENLTVPPQGVEDFTAALGAAKKALTDVVKERSEQAKSTAKEAIDGFDSAWREIVPVMRAFHQAAKARKDARDRLDRVSVKRSGPKGDDEYVSKRLIHFAEMINSLGAAKQRVIGITTYAETEWERKPQELFAEGYALWLTDRPFLERTAPELVKYFDSGEHLK